MPSASAKIWGVAQRDLGGREPPVIYPEYTKPGDTSYVYRKPEFWTSGFFPGSLHLLLERQRKYRHLLHPPSSPDAQNNLSPHPLQLEFACKWWTEKLHRNATLQGTHDLGFMIAPWARLQWELNHDRRSFDTLQTAADTLASRFSDTVGCMRSWDTCETKAYSFTDPSADFLVIIDNMMNLDLLFWAAANTQSPSRSAALYAIAVSHARTTQRHHIAHDSSTTHVVNFDPSTGNPKAKLTNQGHAHGSCWTRGQAWAVAGFAQVHAWTGDESFLATARDCADYFLRRLPDSLVPPWDFDAPPAAGDGQQQPRDTSAALIAAYGMLLVHDALVVREGRSGYLDAALRIVDAVCGAHLNGPAVFEERGRDVETVERGLVAGSSAGPVEVRIGEGDTIVNGATINNYEFAPRRWADHGLVYADYFFLLVGNKLLDMGVGREILRLASE
ncbi:Six-hairpin glycosidase-like protein [Coniochaeta sp. 2T2.1]|nr:Six-hairpin glycosidase-like protein [Coniochaeta sp. 2T2.1]